MVFWHGVEQCLNCGAGYSPRVYITLLEAAQDDESAKDLLESTIYEARRLYILLSETGKRFVSERYNNPLSDFTIEVAASVLDAAELLGCIPQFKEALLLS